MVPEESEENYQKFKVEMIDEILNRLKPEEQARFILELQEIARRRQEERVVAAQNMLEKEKKLFSILCERKHVNPNG